MGNLFSGLEKFGLDVGGEVDLFGEKKKEEAARTGVKEEVIPEEKDFLLDKQFTCPVCEKTFTNKIVKAGKAKRIGSDKDLRTKYEYIDVNKYEVNLCPHCGFAALNRYFKPLIPSQEKMIREKISVNFKGDFKDEAETYSYEYALEKYKLALLNTVVKNAKDSEKAYTCLKIAWVIRGKVEELEQKSPASSDEISSWKSEEEEFLKNAYQGFKKAITSENYPMCGMDQFTVDYLIAVLATKFKEYQVASKIISTLLLSKTVNTRIKNMVLELKEDLIKDMKASTQ